MRRALWLTLGGVLLAPFALLACLRLGLLTPFVNLALKQQLAGRTPLQVRVGVLRSDVLSFIEADDVVVLAPVRNVKLPLLTISSLRLEYRGWQAWRGRVDPQEALRLARVKGLNLFLLREDGGQWNISALLAPKPVSRGAKPASAPLPLIPAARVELEDSALVLNDEVKGFQSSIKQLQGSLDTRALPLLAFSLNGVTEGHSQENLSLAGELDQRDGSFYGRLDLANVELEHYLNYFLPAGGLAFEGGKASLSVRLRQSGEGELDASGRAELSEGALRIPGVALPLSGLQGAVTFDPDSLRFKGVQARFLGSQWSASGAILDLRHPRYEVALQNPAFPLQALSEQVTGLGLLALTGTASLDATLSGPALKPLIQARFTAPLLGIFGVEMSSVSASAKLEGSHLSVSGVRATLWQGHLDGDADMGLGAGGRLRANMQLDGARLEDARLNGQRPLPLSGTAWAEFKASGLLRSPSLELNLEVGKTSLGTLPLGDFEGHATWTPQGLSSRFTALRGALDGRISMSRGSDAAFRDSRIILKGMELGALARGLASADASMALPPSAVRAGAVLADKLSGRLDAALSLDGLARSPSIWIQVDLPQGRLYTPPGALALKEPKKGMDLKLEGALGFQGGNLFMGRNGSPLRAVLGFKGHQAVAQALGHFPLKSGVQLGKLELNLDADLRLLDAFELFKKSQGRLQSDLRLGGTLDSPVASGQLNVLGFAAEPQSYLVPVKDGELRAEFHDQAIDVPQLSFKAGGTLLAKGRLDLSGGLRNLRGDLDVNTDEEGIRLQNWEAMGSGNLALQGFTVHLDGETEPIGLRGRIKLSNALVVYTGGSKSSGPPDAGARKRGFDLDLRVGLGANVWYEKRQTKSLDLLDPTQWLSGAADSAMETLQMPDIFFRMRPTDQDFIIRGRTPNVELLGEVAIDRGRLTVMENDFEIKPDRENARVRFSGRHAEVWATAVGRLRYMRDDPLTKRPRQKAVNVIAEIKPLPPDELEKSDLAKAFPNYRPSFRSEPEIVPNNPELDRSAILNLVVLGDPIVDLTEGPGSAGGEGQSNAQALGMTQLNRIIQAEARKQISKLSKKGFKFLGTNFIDVFRVVPRFKYQSAGNQQVSSSSSGATAAEASKQAQDSQLVFSDLTMEVGKSLGEKLYASFQWIRFGENGSSVNSSQAGQSNRVTRDQGLRAGLEFQVSPNRTLEAYYNYSVDDNLEPVAFDPKELWQAHSGVLRLRNTIPTANYGAEAARRRRWALQLDQNGNTLGGIK